MSRAHPVSRAYPRMVMIGKTACRALLECRSAGQPIRPLLAWSRWLPGTVEEERIDGFRCH